MSHPANGLDEVVHQRVRLGILAVLAEAKHADFRYLKETLQLTDGNLSSHLQVLEDAGCAMVDKSFEGRKPRTKVRITKRGRLAFEDEIARLRDIVVRFEKSGRSG